ncbi:MAG: hypothetical protein ACRD1D_01840 [Acidimicrobiales bacterium]
MPFGDDARAVDLIFGLALVGTLYLLARRWRAFWDADFTAEDRRLATQAAIFVVPPVVVLIHELGHVFGARLVGGRVLDFHYGLIEGSVTVAGRLTPAEHWLIAIIGNLAGGLLGLAMAAIGAGAAGANLRRPLRHVLIVGGLIELGFHLVLYPVISLSARAGDWRVIYDFSATPGLSTVTAAAHVAALAAAWYWWRNRVRRTLFHVDHGLEREVAELEGAMGASPNDPEPVIRLAVLYAANGETSLARKTLDDAAESPVLAGLGKARLQLARARMALIEDRWNQAYLAAREGLDAVGAGDGAAGSEVVQRLWANVGLALASMDRPEQALAAFAHVQLPVADDPRVLYARGLARLACGDRAGGQADLRSVVGWRPEGDLLRQWAEAQLEGREPPPPDDRDRPAYARRTKAPPAPIAGV